MLQRIGTFAESAFCFLAISVYLGAYIPLTQGADYKMGDSNPVNAAAMLLILLGVVVLSAIRWRKMLFVARHGGAVNLFLLLALASALWSYYPVFTLKRFLVLLQTVCFAYYLVAAYPMHRIIRFWAAAFIVAGIASIAVAVAMPGIGTHSEPTLAGAWRGVFSHKSSLGSVSVLGALCIGWLWVQEPRRCLRYTAGLLLCLLLAVMSRSKTGQIAIVLISAVAIFLPLLRLPGLARVWAIFFASVGALAGGTLLIAFFGDIMTAFGKDPSLTGRVPAWAVLLDLAGNHLAGGYGYSAFFIEQNPDTDYVSAMAQWEVVEAHNSYIEVLVQLGLPGLLIATWAIVESVIRSFRAWIAGNLPWASFAVAYTVAFSLTNFVETILFRAGDTHCVMFSLVFVALRIEAAARAARAGSNLLRSGRPVDPLYSLGR